MTWFLALVPASSPLSAAHGSEILSPPGFKEPALLSSLSPTAARERKQNAWGGCEWSTGGAWQQAAVPGGALKKCPSARIPPSLPAARSGHTPCLTELDLEHVSQCWVQRMGFAVGLCVAVCGQTLCSEPPPQARAQALLGAESSGITVLVALWDQGPCDARTCGGSHADRAH